MSYQNPFSLQPDHLTIAIAFGADDEQFKGVILRYLKLPAKVKIRNPLRLFTQKQLETFISSR